MMLLNVLIDWSVNSACPVNYFFHFCSIYRKLNTINFLKEQEKLCLEFIYFPENVRDSISIKYWIKACFSK